MTERRRLDVHRRRSTDLRIPERSQYPSVVPYIEINFLPPDEACDAFKRWLDSRPFGYRQEENDHSYAHQFHMWLLAAFCAGGGGVHDK